jgi:hypothetical protein
MFGNLLTKSKNGCIIKIREQIFVCVIERDIAMNVGADDHIGPPIMMNVDEHAERANGRHVCDCRPFHHCDGPPPLKRGGWGL